ncbi:MAG: hypothetical protein ACKN9U_13320 [Pirellulaceae bacterium]
MESIPGKGLTGGHPALSEMYEILAERREASGFWWGDADRRADAARMVLVLKNLKSSSMFRCAAFAAVGILPPAPAAIRSLRSPEIIRSANG